MLGLLVLFPKLIPITFPFREIAAPLNPTGVRTFSEFAKLTVKVESGMTFAWNA